MILHFGRTVRNKVLFYNLPLAPLSTRTIKLLHKCTRKLVAAEMCTYISDLFAAAALVFPFICRIAVEICNFPPPESAFLSFLVKECVFVRCIQSQVTEGPSTESRHQINVAKRVVARGIKLGSPWELKRGLGVSNHLGRYLLDFRSHYGGFCRRSRDAP